MHFTFFRRFTDNTHNTHSTHSPVNVRNCTRTHRRETMTPTHLNEIYCILRLENDLNLYFCIIFYYCTAKYTFRELVHGIGIGNFSNNPLVIFSVLHTFRDAFNRRGNQYNDFFILMHFF